MSVGEGPGDFELSAKAAYGVGVVAQGGADEFDDVRREVGEVADGFVFDFSVFAEGAAQEVGLVDLALIAPCGGGYMNGAVSFLHGGIIWQFWRQCSLNTLNLSGYILQSMFFR